MVHENAITIIVNFTGCLGVAALLMKKTKNLSFSLERTYLYQMCYTVAKFDFFIMHSNFVSI